MTYPSTRYIRTMAKSAVALFEKEPTVENYWKVVNMLSKVRDSLEPDITRRGREILDKAFSAIDEIMRERRSRQ